MQWSHLRLDYAFRSFLIERGCTKINLAQPLRFIHPIRMILYVEEYTLRGLA